MPLPLAAPAAVYVQLVRARIAFCDQLSGMHPGRFGRWMTKLGAFLGHREGIELTAAAELVGRAIEPLVDKSSA